MSASEKLRVLDDLTTYPAGVIARSDAAHIRGRRLLGALPQLLAVVEAAEKISDPKDYWDWVTGYAPQCKAALAALDSALGDD